MLGIDFECISRDELDGYPERFEATLETINATARLYQVLFLHNSPRSGHRRYEDLSSTPPPRRVSCTSWAGRLIVSPNRDSSWRGAIIEHSLPSA
jgi:hypothetical protein